MTDYVLHYTKCTEAGILDGYLGTHAVGLPVELCIRQDIQSHVTDTHGHVVLAQKIKHTGEAVQDECIILGSLDGLKGESYPPLALWRGALAQSEVDSGYRNRQIPHV